MRRDQMRNLLTMVKNGLHSSALLSRNVFVDHTRFESILNLIES